MKQSEAKAQRRPQEDAEIVASARHAPPDSSGASVLGSYALRAFRDPVWDFFVFFFLLSRGWDTRAPFGDMALKEEKL